MARKKKNKYDDDWYDTAVGSLFHKENNAKIRSGVVCNTPLVRVRSAPSESGDVIRVMDNGDSFEILDEVASRFYKIKVDDDTVGYISCKFCKEV